MRPNSLPLKIFNGKFHFLCNVGDLSEASKLSINRFSTEKGFVEYPLEFPHPLEFRSNI